MIGKRGLRFKLVGSFIVVAIIAVAIGVVGYRGMLLSLRAEHQISAVNLPQIETLWAMKEAQSAITRIERTMAHPTTTASGVAEQRTMLEKAWAEADGWKASFDKIPGKSPAVLAAWDEAKTAWEEWRKAQGKVVAAIGSGSANEKAASFALSTGEARVPLRKSRDQLVKIIELAHTEDLARNKGFQATASNTKLSVVMATLLGVGLALALGFYLSTTISNALNRTTASLSEGATLVTSASGQLTSSSQTLAAGSSEQAASLQETAAAMEEMSAMTRRNTESAGEAKTLSDKAGISVDKANESMNRLVGQMTEISSTGEEIGKIIKTIDEIAFQTNLLALNAAVEAARAGEAGAGFAVVADEVRNLAQRAAGAAKNTGELIEGSIRKIKDGRGLVDRTNADFSEVTASVRKVTELVSEVSAASGEQAKGIGQVSSSVSRMDKVTQGNAASAEEIAAAAEEMNAQAVSMQEIVRNLQALVSGEGSQAARVASPAGTPSGGGRRMPVAGKKRAALSPGTVTYRKESETSSNTDLGASPPG